MPLLGEEKPVSPKSAAATHRSVALFYRRLLHILDSTPPIWGFIQEHGEVWGVRELTGVPSGCVDFITAYLILVKLSGQFQNNFSLELLIKF